MNYFGYLIACQFNIVSKTSKRKSRNC